MEYALMKEFYLRFPVRRLIAVDPILEFTALRTAILPSLGIMM
jgi:hypothetical protein